MDDRASFERRVKDDLYVLQAIQRAKGLGEAEEMVKLLAPYQSRGTPATTRGQWSEWTRKPAALSAVAYLKVVAMIRAHQAEA